jgi:serine protease Do
VHGAADGGGTSWTLQKALAEELAMNRERTSLKTRVVVALFAIALGVSAAAILTGFRGDARAQAPAVTSEKAEAATSYARSLSLAFRAAAQKVLPAVVMISSGPAATEQTEDGEGEPEAAPNEENPFGDMLPPEFRRFFKDMPRRGFSMPRGHEMSIGSGVIIDPSGIILTNNHVVRGGGKIKVRLHDGREFTAVDIKTDPKSDLAILHIENAGKLAAAKFGNSDDTQVGDWVLAIGDPFGQEGTVTAGIISAKGRGLGGNRASFIQTDAAINPGNSGGPLINLDGEVVGINTAISSQTGGNLGVGFAITSDVAKWVSRQLIASGTVRRAYLGVSIQPVSQDLAKQLGVETSRGALIADVQANAPAAAAGVKPGDVIVEFAGVPVGNPQELVQAVDQAPIGEKQTLALIRDGRRITLDVTTKEQPTDYGSARTSPSFSGKEGALRDQKLGIEVTNITDELADKLGVKPGEGVAVTNVRNGSPADLAGLTNGMVIVQVDRKPVKSVDDFRSLMDKQSLADGVLLLVHTVQGNRFVVIRSSK